VAVASTLAFGGLLAGLEALDHFFVALGRAVASHAKF
jgi:hypothetical protein